MNVVDELWTTSISMLQVEESSTLYTHHQFPLSTITQGNMLRGHGIDDGESNCNPFCILYCILVAIFSASHSFVGNRLFSNVFARVKLSSNARSYLRAEETAHCVYLDGGGYEEGSNAVAWGFIKPGS